MISFRAGSRNLVRNVVVLLVGLLLMAGQASPVKADFKKIKVAVLDFQLQGEGFETADMGMIVAEWFTTALVKEGRFDVVERALLNKILNEQKMSVSGIIDENSTTQLGKILGVKIIISGSVMKLRQVLEINARIIDVETASIIAAERVKSSASADLQSLIVQMSEKIIKYFPLEGYVVAREGNSVSIDLGRMAGVRSDMEFMVFKEGRVIKHPKTGEVLDIEKIRIGLLKINKVNNKIAYAVITEESEDSRIAVGHMVKSLSEQLASEYVRHVLPLPPARPSSETSAPKVLASSGDYISETSLPRVLASGQYIDYIAKLRSPNLKDMLWAAKKIVRNNVRDPAVFVGVEEVLLAMYKERPGSRKIYKQHVDVAAWLCKALGASKRPEYKATLLMIAKSRGVHKKIRKYAKIAAKGLR